VDKPTDVRDVLYVPELVVPEPVSTGPPLPVLAVVYRAKKPGFLTEPSVLNFIQRALPDDNIGDGST